MKRRLLDFLVCPRCAGTLSLEVFKEEQAPTWALDHAACTFVCAWRGTPIGDEAPQPLDCVHCYASEVLEGALRCPTCRSAFPIIDGVPRLLNPALLARLRARHPEFFGRHPEFLADATKVDDPLADTFESFTRQRLDLRPPGPAFARQWTQHLRRNLGGTRPLTTLRGKLILDVGCGFGRHLYVASEAGAEVVGVDLSGGVDIARRNNIHHPRCHVVQADFQQHPFRAGQFDIVWSFGVLHHLPDPRAGFAALVPLARPHGGEVIIWVYGYRGMTWTYRLSHMRALHRLVRGLSGAARLRVSQTVAVLLSLFYWEPLRLAKRIGLQQFVERLPITDYVDHDWLARVAGVHDRLSTPMTHFLDREELLAWCREARLAGACVEDTDRRGWRASARRTTQKQYKSGEQGLLKPDQIGPSIEPLL